MKKINWWMFGTVGVMLVLVGALVWWIVSAGSEPLPGTAVSTLDRTHVEDISGIKYDSNPPTSGSHFPIWAKRGIYPQIISDGYLIHSMEHGYIILWYNCGPLGPHTNSLTYAKNAPLTKLNVANEINAQPITPQTLPAKEKDLPADFSSSSCQNLVQQLGGFLNTYQRIVVVPRPNMDSKIVLTAWGRIERLNKFNSDTIKTFIEAYHNKGPEQTIE